MVIYIVISIFVVRRLRKLYLDGLYKVTASNIANISQGSMEITNYPSENITELQELNDNLNTFKSLMLNSTIKATYPDYRHINFQYFDEERKIVDLASFKENLSSVILVSQSYRNVLLELYYDTNEVSEDELMTLFIRAKPIFSSYRNYLFIRGQKSLSLYIYIPFIDSFSRIKEQIEQMISYSTINKHNNIGLVSYPLHACLVCYPFSNEDEMFPDLLYAKRQGKLVNFYLPNRLKTLHNDIIISDSMNLNYMTKLIHSLDNLNYDNIDNEHDLKIFEQTIKGIFEYFHLDHAGILFLDEDLMKYRIEVAVNSLDREQFRQGHYIERSLVDTLCSCLDEDQSYYFSCRVNANNSIGALVDRIGLSSGFYKALEYHGKIIGLVYFFNDKKPFIISSYLRESLHFFANRVLFTRLMNRKDNNILYQKQKFEALLSAGEFYEYKVTDDMVLNEISSSLHTLFPKLKVGEHCYKALYGLEKMCPNCPMKTFVKKIDDFGKKGKFETSLSLNVGKNHNRALLMRHISNGMYDTNRFDVNLLIGSYASLVDYVKNLYYVAARGYLLLLRIDNLETLISSQGSEGANFVLRSFINILKTKLKIEHIFSYNDHTLGILFPEYGHVDIIQKCEQIYEISKQKYYDDGSEDSISITYLPLGFPQGHATAEDFYRSAIRYFNSAQYETGKDYIYFLESGYERSASRRYFMIEVLDRTFVEGNYSFFYQPYVNCDDKRIYGAELLLRIPDSFQGTMLNAFELSRVAAQENKVDLITNALLKTVGALSQQYGRSVFKVNDLKRLSINTDVPFLAKDDFVEQINSIQKEYGLSKNFIGLEIGEWDISHNLAIVEKGAKQAAAIGLPLICDRYTGQYVSMEQLRKLGFTEIKTDRKLAMNIDKDTRRLSELKSLLMTAAQNDIKVTVVGIENSEQYLLVKEMDENCFLQGYHFYKPLDKNNLISALQISNK